MSKTITEEKEKNEKIETDLSKIPILIEKSHPIIEKCIVDMIAANYLPFYGEFCLNLVFIKANIGTMGVSATSKGLNLLWDEKFVSKQSLETMNFLIIHEIFHLLLDHVERSVGYDKRIANIAQDMIINTIIYEEIIMGMDNKDKVIMPKDEFGNNSGYYVPKAYKGELMFESLYKWLKEDKEHWDKTGKSRNSEGQGQGQGQSQGQGQGQSQGQSQGNPYGDYGDHAKEMEHDDKKERPGMYSLEDLYKNLDENKGMTLDVHVEGGDQVPKEVKQQMVNKVLNSLKNRGLMKGNDIENILNKLRKTEKDYLKDIKRSITNEIMEGRKSKSITRPNRRSVWGLKGKRKFKQKINCILDTSGSMSGDFEKALSFIFQNDISINLIQIDTDVQDVVQINNKKELERMKIKGLGGTTLSPALKLISDSKDLNQFNTVVLTDGHTDSLNCSAIKGSILIISNSKKCPIENDNGKIKQIVIENKN